MYSFEEKSTRTQEKKSKKKIKKKDMIRMQNFDKKVDDLDKTEIYEYLLLVSIYWKYSNN